ncbi:MAG: PAS domain S-box protein, partial [Leptolyngbyaceae bacterium]|nr:PAS domain S-box protein [Leptolyngbyaceae bacterium]
QAILGTFALYYREVRSPRADELALVDSLVQIIMLAIQRHQNEIALKQTNRRLQEAQHIAHLGNWELDLEHNTLHWSEEVFHIFEIDSQHVCASYEAFLDLVHPDDRTTVNEAYSQHLRDRQPYSLVHRLHMPDGRIKHVRELCETRYSADGSPLLSRGTVQDITQQREAELRRERAEASLRQVIEGTAAFTGEEFFPALVRHISEALGVRFVSVGHATSEGFHVLAFCAEGELCLPQFLPYEWVPCCYQAIQDGSCCHPAGLQDLYPGYTLFTDLQAESYLGVRLNNAAGEPNGSLCIFHDAPLADPDWAQTLLSTFVPRAGAELERLLTAQALEQLNADLEKRVAQRTAELAEREALLQDFLDNANDLIQIVDIETGRFQFVNRAWLNTLGYTAAEVEQLTCFDVLAADCHPHCQAAFAQMQSGCTTGLDRVELIFVSKSGQQVVVEGNVNCRVETQSDGSQRAVSTRGIFRDITARKEAEQELQRREARYRGLLEAAPDAILLADLQGNILEANQQAETLLGYPLAELTTMHFSQLHPAEALTRARHNFAEIVQKQRTQVLDEIFRRVDGTTVPVDITATVIDLNGETLVQGIFRDISERKAIEQALQESRQFLQTVLDTVPLRVFWKDRESRYLGANARFLADAALSSEADILGKNDFDMPWTEAEAEAYRADDLSVMKSGEAKLGIIETQYQQDGKTIWLETNKLPLRNLTGDVIGVLGTYQDITDRRNEQVALQQRTAELDRFFSLALELLCIATLEGRFIRLNHQWEKVLDYPLWDLEGAEFIDFVHPEDVEMTLQAMQRLEQGEEIMGFTNRYRCRDGSYRWIEWTSTPSNGLIYAAARDITERKQAEMEWQSLTNRLTLALQAGAYGTWDWDLVNDALWDERMYEIYGIQDLGRSVSYQEWRDCVHPDDINWIEAQFETALQNRTPFQAEFRIWRMDGELRWVQIFCRQQYDAQGNPVRVVAINCDITERKSTEMLIRQHAEQETLLREITHKIRQSLELQTIFNNACEETRLVLQADRVGIFKFYPETNWEEGEFVAESVVEGFVSVMATPIHDHCFGEKYAPLYLQGQYAAMEDIYQLESLCHTDVLAQFQVRANLVVPLLDGKNLWGLLCIHQCSGTRQWQPFEINLTQHIASQLAIAIQQANLFGQLQQELEERQQAQTQLSESNYQLAVTNQELARATRLKDEFLANMSHELRTPLNAILGMSEVLLEEVFGALNPKQKQYIEVIQSSGHHLLTLINDILDVAKIASGQIKLEYSYISIEQLCSSSLTFIKQQALNKEIQLETDIEPFIPDLFADEIRIRQILLNLLSNAVKFTPEGGTVTLTVLVLPQEQDTSQPTYLRIAIADTGIGIAPENIPQLFKPFVQIDGALNRQQTGTGLGLALVKQMTELHGGRVGLTSQVGEGSCFTVDFPYVPQSASVAQTDEPQMALASHAENVSVAPESEESTPHASTPILTQAPLVLIAEDNLANIATISSYFETKNYRLLIAHDGQEAIDMAIAHYPDVILMDVQMPGMDGLEAMRQIRQHERLRQIPIIALTALAMKGDQERCLAAGADYYLSKPVKLKQLHHLIQEILSDGSFE